MANVLFSLMKFKESKLRETLLGIINLLCRPVLRKALVIMTKKLADVIFCISYQLFVSAHSNLHL